jgi:peptidoglycan LD-endopeptidase LytH
MFFKVTKVNHIKAVIFSFIILLIVITVCTYLFLFSKEEPNNEIAYPNTEAEIQNNIDEYVEKSEMPEKSYIKWVDFQGTAYMLKKLSDLDISSHRNNEDVQFNWIELMSYFACKYGGDFSKFNQADLNTLVTKLKSGLSISELTKDFKLYNYYFESLDAIFHEYIGTYTIQTTDENGNKSYKTNYGLKVFSPIARGYSFSHYKDFGTSRSYGYRRKHLGNDLLGSIGTPIIAVESGYVEALGWNQYGGWRVGIRSFDGKRYYYYAHLRKDHPYAKDLSEGQLVNAGDVIGYLGMTGYSSKENVNNINIPHLHFGLQLIFNEVQKEGTNQIWIDVYQIVEFLRNTNSSQVYMAYKDTNDFERVNDMMKEE